MKPNLLFLSMSLFSIFGCGPKNNLPKGETDLMNKINFDADVLSELRLLTNSELKQLPAIDQETGDVRTDKFYDGVYSVTSEEQAMTFVSMLKEKFRKKGYLIFLFEGEDYKSVAVIKGTDDLDILRYRKTDGINYDLENDDVVSKIAEWKSKFGLVVLGCGRDWLHVEFDKLPTDLDAFAEEVYAFCPDSVDQGVGSIEELKEAIVQMRGVWLWWD